MRAKELVSAISIGCLLIALGMVPGLFKRLEDGMRNFYDSFSSFPARVPHHTEYEKLPRQLWLAVIGLALIVISLWTYISN